MVAINHSRKSPLKVDLKIYLRWYHFLCCTIEKSREMISNRPCIFRIPYQYLQRAERLSRWRHHFRRGGGRSRGICRGGWSVCNPAPHLCTSAAAAGGSSADLSPPRAFSCPITCLKGDASPSQAHFLCSDDFPGYASRQSKTNIAYFIDVSCQH